MTHTLLDLLKHNPCRDGIDQLLKRECKGEYTEKELDMELTMDNIRHCNVRNIVCALVHLGYSDIVENITPGSISSNGSTDYVALNAGDAVYDVISDAASAVRKVSGDYHAAQAETAARDKIHNHLMELICNIP